MGELDGLGAVGDFAGTDFSRVGAGVTAVGTSLRSEGGKKRLWTDGASGGADWRDVRLQPMPDSAATTRMAAPKISLPPPDSYWGVGEGSGIEGAPRSNNQIGAPILART